MSVDDYYYYFNVIAHRTSDCKFLYPFFFQKRLVVATIVNVIIIIKIIFIKRIIIIVKIVFSTQMQFVQRHR